MSNSLILNSSDVRVFPSSKRNTIDPAAKYTTEYNLVNLVNRLTNRDAFVITNVIPEIANAISDTSIADKDNLITGFEFNIKGYYFIVNLNKGILKNASISNKYLNAYITINQTAYGDTENFKNFWTLGGVDDKNYFLGLQLKWENTSTYKNESGVNSLFNGEYSFTIIEYDNINNSYLIPKESKIRLFTNESHKSIYIDDGII